MERQHQHDMGGPQPRQPQVPQPHNRAPEEVCLLCTGVCLSVCVFVCLFELGGGVGGGGEGGGFFVLVGWCIGVVVNGESMC